MGTIPKNVNKELRKVIRRWAINNLETLSIARVTNVDDYPLDRMVNVLPLTIEMFNDGSARRPGVVEKCPVIIQGTQNGFLSFPIKEGDTVIVGFCKQNLGEYLFTASKEQYLPGDFSVFGSTDAVVLGYLASAGTDKELSPDNLELNFQDSSLVITPENHISLSNPEGSVSILADGACSVKNSQAEISVFSSGVVEVSNSSGDITLKANGEAGINGATITTSGDVVTDSGASLDTLWQTFNLHGHTPNASSPPSPQAT